MNERRESLTEGKSARQTCARFATMRRFVITPGSAAGEPLHVFSSLERRSLRWDTALEAARAALSAQTSLLLRLLVASQTRCGFRREGLAARLYRAATIPSGNGSGSALLPGRRCSSPAAGG